MLIINIPKCHIAKYAPSLRDLKENRDIDFVSQRFSHPRNKIQHIWDVLQGHLTTDEIRNLQCILFGEKLLVNFKVHTFRNIQTIRAKSGIKADTFVPTNFTNELKKFPLAAPDF